MTKIVIFLVIMIGCAFGGYQYGIRQASKLHAELIGQTQAYEQLSKEMASLQVNYKNQGEIITKYEQEFNTRPKSGVIAVTGTKFGINGKVFDEKLGAKFYEIYLPDGENKGPALGVVMMGNKITTKAYNHELEIVQGIERDKKTGRYRILARGYYVLKETDSKWRDKRFSLPVTGGEAVVDPVFGEIVKNKFWLKPRVHLGLQMTYPNKAPLPALSVYPFSYGPNSDGSVMRFIGTGLSGDSKKVVLSITPVAVNLNKAIKFFHNTYIGPVISIDQNGKKAYGAGIDVGF